MKVLIISMSIVIAGMACVLIEHKFYQYIDQDGVLHESMFLPMGAVLLMLGTIGIVFSLARIFVQIMRNDG